MNMWPKANGSPVGGRQQLGPAERTHESKRIAVRMWLRLPEPRSANWPAAAPDFSGLFRVDTKVPCGREWRPMERDTMSNSTSHIYD